MTDNTELKLLAEAAIIALDEYNADECNYELAEAFGAADDAFHDATGPATVLALIAENELLAKTADCWDRLNVQNKALSDSFRVERDQLKAENNRLQSAANTLARIGYTDHGGELWKPPIGQKPNFDQIDHLRAEIAGLKTGYEAYERVNAELKAEVEALRKLGPSKEIIWCACGDGYPVNSHGAGFMDANNGVCANCDAALGQGEQS